MQENKSNQNTEPKKKPPPETKIFSWYKYNVIACKAHISAASGSDKKTPKALVALQNMIGT